MMDPLPPFSYESANRPLRISRLQQFNLGLTNHEECSPYFLIRHFFDTITGQSQNLFIKRNGFIQTHDRNSNVLNVGWFHPSNDFDVHKSSTFKGFRRDITNNIPQRFIHGIDPSMNPFTRRSLKIIRKLSLVLLILLATAALAGISLFIIYKDSFQQAMIRQLNHHLTSEVQAGRISVSLLRHFPLVSLNLSDLRIKNPQNLMAGANVIQTEEISLQFDLIDLIRRKYTLQIVKITNASINLVVHEDGSDNFHFWKKPSSDEPGNFSVELRQLILKGVDVSWLKIPSSDQIFFSAEDMRIKGNLTSVQSNLNVHGDLMFHLIRIGNQVYLQDREMKTNVSLNVNSKDHTVQILEGTIRTGLLVSHIQGSVLVNERIEPDVQIRFNTAPFDQYLDLFPPGYLLLDETMEVAGDVKVSLILKGIIGENTIPELAIGFDLYKGSFHYLPYSLRIDNITLSGSYSLITPGLNAPTDELRIHKVKALFGDGWIEGRLKIANLSRPFVSLFAEMELSAEDVAGIFPIGTIKEMNGKLAMTLDLKGAVNTLNHPATEDILAASVQLDMNISLDHLLFESSTLPFRNIRAEGRLNNHDLQVRSLSGRMGNSDFRIEGVFMNFLPWLINKNEMLRIDADLEASRLNLDEILIQDSSPNNHAPQFSIPKMVAANLDISIGNFSFHDFTATQLTTALTLRDKKVVCRDLRFHTMEGSVSADASLLQGNDDMFQVKANARLKQLNINQLFHNMRNFGQKGLTDEHLRGFLDADVYYSSSLTDGLAVDPKTIYAIGQLSIGSGELIGYTPLYKLSGFLDLDELKHIRFSELKNLIEIRNQTIIIPEMEIKSTTLDLALQGTHSFDNRIDYHVNILLSQLLSARFNTRSQDEFGVVEDDGLRRTKIYIAITGTTDDPTFSFDRPAMKDGLSENLENERREIKKALQDEFRASKKDVQDTEKWQQQEKSSFIIEWDEKPVDSAPEVYQPEKLKGPKFRIKWEEEDTIPLPKNH